MLVHSENKDMLIESNVITQTGWACDCGHIPGARFLNNTFWDNAFGGILLADDQPEQHARTRGLVIENNIMPSLALGAGGPLSAMIAVADWNLVRDGSGIGAHDISGSPTFANAAARDHRLAAGSRGIDAGTSTGTPTADLLTAARFDDPTVLNTGGGVQPWYDLGAYERGGGSGPEPDSSPPPVTSPPLAGPLPAPSATAPPKARRGPSVRLRARSRFTRRLRVRATVAGATGVVRVDVRIGGALVRPR